MLVVYLFIVVAETMRYFFVLWMNQMGFCVLARFHQMQSTEFVVVVVVVVV